LKAPTSTHHPAARNQRKEEAIAVEGGERYEEAHLKYEEMVVPNIQPMTMVKTMNNELSVLCIIML
jgi:hypothetical protein